jgi:Uma2 family endonuclease
MSSHPKRFYTLEEYSALEMSGAARYEYWNGDIVCMSGGSKEHGFIAGNVYFALRSQLRGRPCNAVNSEIPIKTPTLPPYRYPDASVVCGPPTFEKILGVDALTNPTVIVEVLSPHTEQADRGAKFDAYKALETVREYLLIDQDAPHVTHYVRRDDGSWRRTDIGGQFARVTFESFEATLTFDDIYEGIVFA